MTQPSVLKDAPKRLLSVDAFRALTMLLMIFINDLSGVKGMPDWMDHAKGYEDSMGFADTIFPAFLFIVGLSIPLSIGRKMQKGESFNAIAFSILSRSFALIVMGFFHVNLEDYSSASILPESVWEILITLSFFLIWLDYSPTISNVKKYFLIGGGWLILLLMAFLFNGGNAKAPEGMHPSWWGILGIIGWGYLVSAFVYLITKGKLQAMIIALVIFAAINIVEHIVRLHVHLWVVRDASSEFLIIAGTVVSLWYARMVQKGHNASLWLWMFAAGCLSIICGLLIRPYTAGISKIRSTPAWILICIGISILVFELMIYLVDFKGKKNWFKLIWPAGTATLTCYLIPYLQVGFLKLFHIHYPSIINAGIGGFLRSWATAFIVVMIGGFLERKKLKLKI
jgi:heparan-alpha-glucosaminide N-acetyltransferase